ncbi:ABC transporter substrate-binding protein [Aquibium sp. A9E412]|uniref:ABC transporter substrate-binding protein n=1 Tax=Aquibium sp. A9E412 TaxID=2976767 RepID=UPI0025B26C2B|nr:ABC transporter substrate-binding protein [Aquibium sp. A9E412]MDN2568180.1 ABC transporter substrate-binding protein [Aquibium sp. A9E412]
MVRNTRRVFAASVAAAAMLAASAAQAEDVKIGFLGGFTGPIESLVPPIFNGAELAVTHVNEQGGILDGELQLVQGDTTCADTTAAAGAADRMVNSENVTALVGPLCSGATIAAANTAAIPGGVMLISPAATSPALTELEDNDLVFRTTPSDAYQGEMLAKTLRGDGVESIAISYVNNDYGKGFADALASAFEAQGGTVAANEAHEDGKADYRAEVGSLAAAGAEMLVVLAYADGSGQTILRQAIEGGDFSRFAGGDGMVSGALIPAVGEGRLDGMIATRAGSNETPGTEVFNKLAEEAGVDPNGTYVAQSYDAAFLIALAIQQNGSGDREGLSEALRAVASAPGEMILPGEWEKARQLIAEGTDINYEGASGSHEFDDNGDVPGVILRMEVEGDEFAEVGQVE